MINLEIGSEKVDKWNALPQNYKPSDLEYLPMQYCSPESKKRQMQLRKEALCYTSKMLDNAYKNKIDIKCVSAFRSYDYQNNVYQKAVKRNGGKIQNVVAKPGHSEHQLGVAIDLSSHEIDYDLSETFAETKAYKWLLQNVHKYGFQFSYTKENHKEKGYVWEPWHLRYIGQENKLYNKKPS